MLRLWRLWSAWLILVVGALLAGCGNEPKVDVQPVRAFAGLSLTVGALDAGALLAGVAPQRGEWEASSGGQIKTVEEPLTLDSLSAVDVILFPARRLGDLVEKGALAAIPSVLVMPPRPAELDMPDELPGKPASRPDAPDDAFQYMDFAPAFREQASLYGKERLALPCGSSALALVYRRDAFESDSNRAAAQQAGLTVPPVTWTQLDAIAKFFQGRDWDGDGQLDHGIAVALGPEPGGVGDAAFLARAASLGQHPDHYSFLFDSDVLTPRVDSPPFVEALQGLIAWKAFGPADMHRFDAATARAAFRTGKVAILIDVAERASDWSHGKPVGVWPLPGSDRVFEPVRKEWKPAAPINAPGYLPEGGGWLIGINSGLSGKQFAAALDLAKYLTSPENSNRLRTERTFPMLPVRESQMDQGLPDPSSAPDVDSRLWSVAVRQTLTSERSVTGLRIPSADLYLSDLATARVAAVNGEAPAKALQGLAKAWTDRTARLGPQHQLWHYRRSLNSLVTLPQPPEPGK